MEETDTENPVENTGYNNAANQAANPTESTGANANADTSANTPANADTTGTAGANATADGGLENLNLKALALIFGGIIIFGVVSFMGIGKIPMWAEYFFSASLEVAPFMILALGAYLSKKYEGLKIFTTIWLLVIIAGLAFYTLSLGIFAVLPPEALSEFNAAGHAAMEGGTYTFTNNAAMEEAMKDAIVPILYLMFGVTLAGLLSLAAQIRAVRVLLSRYIPIDPDSFVHKTALTAIFAIIFMFCVPLLVLGEPPLLSATALEILKESLMSIQEENIVNVFTLFWMILGSMIVAGLYINKTPSQVMTRLGLKMPTAKEVALAIGIAVVLVLVFEVVDHVISAAFQMLGLHVTDADKVNILFAPFLTPFSAILAAISAGFGEEIAVRGLLQERFGILIPTAFFAMLHALQYNWDGVISVFLTGLIFALLRRHYHTTFSAITHATYDLILFYMIIFGITLL